MPKDRTVVLNYDSKDKSDPFRANPLQVEVAPNDSIRFRIGDSTRAEIPGCKLEITLHDGSHFSHGALKHSKEQTGAEELVLGVKSVPAADLSAAGAPNKKVITRYDCQLLNADLSAIPGLKSQSGGEIVPESTGT